MQRINTEQHNEIERIEDSKGYNQKIESLLNELAVSNQKNKEYEKCYTIWFLAYELSSDLNGMNSEETGDTLCKMAIISRELKKSEEYFKFSKLFTS